LADCIKEYIGVEQLRDDNKYGREVGFCFLVLAFGFGFCFLVLVFGFGFRFSFVLEECDSVVCDKSLLLL
jgi:hypothetical protein